MKQGRVDLEYRMINKPLPLELVQHKLPTTAVGMITLVQPNLGRKIYISFFFTHRQEVSALDKELPRFKPHQNCLRFVLSHPPKRIYIGTVL